MPPTPTASGAAVRPIQFDWSADAAFTKPIIAKVDSPRRTCETRQRPCVANLNGAATVGQPLSPRGQAEVADSSLFTFDRPLDSVVASGEMRRQIEDHHRPADGAGHMPAAALYAPLVSEVSDFQVTSWYDAIGNRIFIGIPGGDGATTEVRMALSPDGRSVTGMEQYSWSGPEDVADLVLDALAKAGVIKLVTRDGEQVEEVDKKFLDGNLHKVSLMDVPANVRYDPRLHQVRITALEESDCEFRVTLDSQMRGRGRAVVGVHNYTQSGPQRVPTETLETLVHAGVLHDSLLAIRLAGAHTPRADAPPPILESQEPEPARPAAPQPARRVPSPVNSAQRPSLDLPIADVIANTGLRDQVLGRRSGKRRLSWGSHDEAQVQAQHGHTNYMANGETIQSLYDASLNLIWARVGSGTKAPLVRIKLSPDRKTVLRIDEPAAGAAVASREALTELIKAGVIQPQVLQVLHPNAQRIDAPGAEKLLSSDPEVRLKAALGLAMYGTATPHRSEQKSKIEEWADYLLWQIELPFRKDAEGETVTSDTAIIDLRGMYAKSQTDLLSALGAVGWQALFERAREIGATKVVPVFKGPGAAKLINAAKAAVPQLERAVVSASDPVDGAIRVDLDELNKSAPAIVIQIEESEDGQAESLEVFVSQSLDITVRRPEGQAAIAEGRMNVSRRTDDPEVRMTEPLRYEAD